MTSNEAEEVRTDIGERIILNYFENNVDDIVDRDFSVKDAKLEAQGKHRKLKEKARTKSIVEERI